MHRSGMPIERGNSLHVHTLNTNSHVIMYDDAVKHNCVHIAIH